MVKNTTQQEQTLLRNYKDSVFRMLFNDKDKAIEIYNAINSTNYTSDTPVTFTTLEQALFRNRKNDVSFTLADTFIVLLEHQSTLSFNLAIRDLIYYALTLQRMFPPQTLLQKSRVKIPRPQFIVFYNGPEDTEDSYVVNLSDNFLGEGEISLQLTVRVYNINKGKNPELMKRSKTLYEYSLFVDMIRTAASEGELTEEVMGNILRECIRQDILKDFLQTYGTEVIGMLFVELTEEEDRELSRQDGIADGIEIGRKEGRKDGLEQGIRAMIRDNLEENTAPEKIVQKLIKGFGLSEEEAAAFLEKYSDSEG